MSSDAIKSSDQRCTGDAKRGSPSLICAVTFRKNNKYFVIFYDKWCSLRCPSCHIISPFLQQAYLVFNLHDIFSLDPYFWFKTLKSAGEHHSQGCQGTKWTVWFRFFQKHQNWHRCRQCHRVHNFAGLGLASPTLYIPNWVNHSIVQRFQFLNFNCNNTSHLQSVVQPEHVHVSVYIAYLGMVIRPTNADFRSSHN